ncbi:plexin-A1-like, partial [Mercenaria mercenaria]|uniref:plexin-A1-like n=1 Tax=Mercenaria mercenaria TaxID=6596 RepID=UPI00234E8F60
IVCTTTKKITGSSEKVILTVKKKSSTEEVYFTYKNATFTEISPKFGPVVGGTQLTIYGENLGIGNRHVKVALGPNALSLSDCLDAKVKPETNLDATSNANFTIQCRIKVVLNDTERKSLATAYISIDGTLVLANVPVNFTFLPNPEIEQISPKKGTVSGGTGITITGKNMNNTHIAKVEGNFQGEKLKSTCEIQSPTKTICRAPKATKAVQDMVEELIKSPRTKRSDCSTCIDITVYLDGFGANFTLTYYRDPSIHPFEEKDKVHLFSDENKKLTIRVSTFALNTLLDFLDMVAQTRYITFLYLSWLCNLDRLDMN